MNHAAEISNLYELLAQQTKALATIQDQLVTLSRQFSASLHLTEESARIEGSRMNAMDSTLRSHQQLLTQLVVRTQLLAERLDEQMDDNAAGPAPGASASSA